MLWSDNGPEFLNAAMVDWARIRTGLSYSPPGSPWCNGYAESFNSRLRDECLNINRLLLAAARPGHDRRLEG